MPHSTTNPAYDVAAPLWRTCRDAVAGERAVHARGERYLPRLTGQSDDDYSAYVLRASFYGAARRTIDGLTGMVFRKPPVLDIPAALEPLTDDMTLSIDNTESVARVAEISLREVLTVGRIGWLVEYPQAGADAVTEAEAQSRNLRPYATMYPTESIIDWKSDRVNNTAQLVMVKLYEVVTGYDSRWRRIDTEQERWLLLEDGRYLQRIYRGDQQFGDDIIPVMNGSALSYIPFIGIGSGGMGLDNCIPPLMDLVDLNLSHYRTSADLEHGAHFTGLPTPMIFGAQLPEGEKLAIGSTQFLVLPNPDASAQFLEFTGQGLGSLERLLDVKQAQMAALGARMLAADKRQAEAEGTVKLRTSGESAVLATEANIVSEAIQRILRIMADWSRIAGEILCQLNTDYYEPGITAQELTALVQTWQAGAISTETLFWNLQQGEMTPPDANFEDEQEKIANQTPVSVPVAGLAGA